MELAIKESKKFKELYQKVLDDEKVVEISDAVGITIIRKYNKDSEYFKDEKKMFINLYLKDAFLVGGINMVEEGKNGIYTIISDNKKYKKKFTGFSFGSEDKIMLVYENDKILVNVIDKKFSLNEFVNLLVKNHLSDRLFWIRKKNYLKKIIKKIILNIIFFLTDDKYDWVEYFYRNYNKLQEDKINNREKKELKISSEPFFQYFKIHKNMLFVLFVILFFVLIIIKKYKLLDEQEISTSNPILLSAFIIILFLFHYFSSFLHLKKRDKNGFIYKLHNSLLKLNESFKLRI